jgi:hypothetical protein
MNGEVTGGSGGWQVDPAQVREFAAAVDKVRGDLNRISNEVSSLSTTATPMLGTSPVGQELSEKFTDRIGGDGGLRGQLQTALQRMEEFVASAERTAAGYQQTDDDSAAGYRVTGG